MDFSGHTSLEHDLGPIGNGGGRGWVAHQPIAVNPSSLMVFGLISHVLHVRNPAHKKLALAARRAQENRESRLWVKGLDENRQWIEVADRGADILEFPRILQDRKRRFIVRSSWELEGPGRAVKPTRKAILSAVSRKVTLRPPHVRKGEYRLESPELTAVRVWESKPPNGTKALEWILLTSEAADSPESLKKVCKWYLCQMQIEEYDKIQSVIQPDESHFGEVGKPYNPLSETTCQYKKWHELSAVSREGAFTFTHLRIALVLPPNSRWGLMKTNASSHR